MCICTVCTVSVFSADHVKAKVSLDIQSSYSLRRHIYSSSSLSLFLSWASHCTFYPAPYKLFIELCLLSIALLCSDAYKEKQLSYLFIFLDLSQWLKPTLLSIGGNIQQLLRIIKCESKNISVNYNLVKLIIFYKVYSIS